MIATPETSIVVSQPHVNISTQSPHITGDITWLDYFDISGAIRDWYAHLEALPTHSNERNTLRNYAASLIQFFQWGRAQSMGLHYERQTYPIKDIVSFLEGVKAGNTADIIHPLPTAQLVTSFYVWVRDTGRGVSESTFNAKYHAPLRIYLKALLSQDSNVPLEAYMRFIELKGSIRHAHDLKIKAPPKTGTSPLHDFGTRLSLDQVRIVKKALDATTLEGLQNIALWLVAIHSGLRRSELARVNPESFKKDGDHHTITVRGKGSKFVPVPIGESVYKAVMAWIDAYNATDTPTPIIEGTSIWRGLTKSGAIAYNPKSSAYGAISDKTIYNRINKMVQDSLGISFATHDTRRTCASLAYKNNMTLANIQQLLRHQRLDVTAKYIGNPRDLEGTKLSNFITV